MGYEISLNMAWEELQKLALPQICSLSLLSDTFEIQSLASPFSSLTWLLLDLHIVPLEELF